MGGFRISDRRSEMSSSAPATPAGTPPKSKSSKSSPSKPSPAKSSPAQEEQHVPAIVREVCLPQARVKTIMKSSPDVDAVSQESLFLITKATELFVMYLTKLAQRHGDNDQRVDYADLASVVQRKDSMEFLHDIVPKKITFAKYLEMIKNEKDTSENTDEIMKIYLRFRFWNSLQYSF